MPNGDPVDVDKDAFDATVEEVRATFRLLFDFFCRPRAVAARDLGRRLPRHPGRRRRVGGRAGRSSTRCSGPPASSAALGVAGGRRGTRRREGARPRRRPHPRRRPAPPTPRFLEGLRSWVNGSAPRRSPAVYGDRLPVGVRAAYGFEPDRGLHTPEADNEARAASSVDVFDDDPATCRGVDADLALTLVYLPRADPGRRPGPVAPRRLGGGLEYTEDGSPRASTTPSRGVPLSPRRGAGTAPRPTRAHGRSSRSAGPTTRRSPGADGRAAPSRRRRPAAPRHLAGVVAAGGAQGGGGVPRTERRRRLHLLAQPGAEDAVRRRPRLRQGRPAARGRPEGVGAAPPTSPPALAGAGASAAEVGDDRWGASRAKLPPRTTTFGPFRVLENRVAAGPDAWPATATHEHRGRHGGLDAVGPVHADGRPHRDAGVAARRRRGARTSAARPRLRLQAADGHRRRHRRQGAVKGGGFLRLDADKGEYAGVLELASGDRRQGDRASSTRRPPSPPAGRCCCCSSRSSASRRGQLGARLQPHRRRRHPRAAARRVGRASCAPRSAPTSSTTSSSRPTRSKNAPRILGRLRTRLPGEGRRAHRRADRRDQLGTPPLVTARLAILAQFGGVFGGGDFRFTRLTRARHGPRDRAASDGRRAAARRPHRRSARRLRRRVRAARDRRPAARLDARRRRVQRLAHRPRRPRRATRRSRSPPAASTPRSPTCRRRCRRGSIGSACSGRSATRSADAAGVRRHHRLELAARRDVHRRRRDRPGRHRRRARLRRASPTTTAGSSVAIDGHVRIRWRGHTLMSVDAARWSSTATPSRSGTPPARRRSRSCGGTRTVDFEHTWGDETAPSRPGHASTRRDAVRAALADPANWSAPAAQRRRSAGHARQRAASTGAGVLAHPLGTLTRHPAGRAAGTGARPPRRRPVAPGTIVTITAVRVGTAEPTRPRPIDAAVPARSVPGAQRARAAHAEVVRGIPGRRRDHTAGPGQPRRHGRHRSTSSRSPSRPTDVAAPEPAGFPADHACLHARCGRARALAAAPEVPASAPLGRSGASTSRRRGSPLSARAIWRAPSRSSRSRRATSATLARQRRDRRRSSSSRRTRSGSDRRPSTDSCRGRDAG